ncbi:hypothetical protein CCACVL1_07331 [Corchorus capsularis]|uniref:Muniscin C-terminal domain-containing protein n=1 Tax=Corchorus capsularis TaxID=210143 RepID=A0A1R3J709_COCAP|nr:hypothetical protein CCACVL1_07331 [Corchorus capsularis]
MIQYVSNPELLAPLNDVTFILKLPVDPTLLKVSPKAVLNRSERELKWHVPEIPLKGTPGKLRARMPVDSNEDDEELEVVAYVKFSMQGATTLSGVCLRPASEVHLILVKTVTMKAGLLISVFLQRISEELLVLTAFALFILLKRNSSVSCL